MAARGKPTKRVTKPSGEDRILAALRAGFSEQVRTTSKLLTAAEFRQTMAAFGRNVDRSLSQISASIDRLTEAMTTSYAQLHEALVEQGRRIEENNRHIGEQGGRMEAMNRRIDENTAAIRENTTALLKVAEAIRGSSGDGHPRRGA